MEFKIHDRVQLDTCEALTLGTVVDVGAKEVYVKWDGCGCSWLYPHELLASKAPKSEDNAVACSILFLESEIRVARSSKGSNQKTRTALVIWI